MTPAAYDCSHSSAAGLRRHHPHTVETADQLTYTRTVELVFERGSGPILPQPIHSARVTLIRFVYTFVPSGSGNPDIFGWSVEIGPVHGHVIDDAGRLGTRVRSLRPRDHSPDGWPAWVLELAQAHMPESRIIVTEETPE